MNGKISKFCGLFAAMMLTSSLVQASTGSFGPDATPVSVEKQSDEALQFARRGRGADDGPGHVRGGHGADDGPNHT